MPFQHPGLGGAGWGGEEQPSCHQNGMTRESTLAFPPQTRREAWRQWSTDIVGFGNQAFANFWIKTEGRELIWHALRSSFVVLKIKSPCKDMDVAKWTGLLFVSLCQLFWRTNYSQRLKQRMAEWEQWQVTEIRCTVHDKNEHEESVGLNGSWFKHLQVSSCPYNCCSYFCGWCWISMSGIGLKIK